MNRREQVINKQFIKLNNMVNIVSIADTFEKLPVDTREKVRKLGAHRLIKVRS